MRAGIEVGGTFTDLVAIDGGQIRVVKVPSTPASPDVGAFAALGAAGIEPAAVTDLVHGSTVATNAILERRGATVAFITTEGFRDLLFLQRHDRRSIYDLHYKKPVPPVRRRDCLEARERIDASGTVLIPLDEQGVTAHLLPALRAGGFGAVAICLLSAYVTPVHEIRLREMIAAALPGLRITCSHEVAPEFREFERASTTVLSAYVQPVIDGYLDRFEATLRQAGFAGQLSVMQSNGGRMPAAAMRRNAITALLSGPAAGVVGAIRQASFSGRSELITFDMGGTSTDVALVTGGEPPLAPETAIDGLPIRTPVLDIVTVGAGGGSLIWLDEGGMLRAGPRSAGAVPGPACYGKGGTEPTVTDAHVVRGTIRPDAFLGGGMTLDPAAAHQAFVAVAATLGMSVEDAAAAAIQLAVANIVRAIQLVSTERGRDPRDYVLLPYGGAGPLLAAEVAEELGIREILVPPNPGVMSALGLLFADYMKVSGVTRRMPLGADAVRTIRDEYARFAAASAADFAALGVTGPVEHTLDVDMRFVGQAFEIQVPVDLAHIASLDAADLAARFAQEHHRVYQHGAEAGRATEMVGLRFGVRRRLQDLPRTREQPSGLVRPASTMVVVGKRRLEAKVLDAALVGPEPVTGPALIEGYSSTTWLPEGWQAARDAAGNLLMRKHPTP